MGNKNTVADLKQRLNEILNMLEDYEDGDKLNLQSNTYFCEGSDFMSWGNQGYIPFENPVRDGEDE